MSENRKANPVADRQYQVDSGTIRLLFVGAIVSGVLATVLLLVLGSAGPKGNYVTPDRTMFQATLSESADVLENYHITDTEGRYGIPVHRAIEIVAAQGLATIQSSLNGQEVHFSSSQAPALQPNTNALRADDSDFDALPSSGSHDAGHGDAHGSAHADSHGGSHGATLPTVVYNASRLPHMTHSLGESGETPFEEFVERGALNPQEFTVSDSHGGHGAGHGTAHGEEHGEGHDTGHGEEHGADDDAHGTDTHSTDAHSTDSHDGDASASHTDDSHADTAHADDSHADTAHADVHAADTTDTHADAVASEDTPSENTPSENTHGEDTHEAQPDDSHGDSSDASHTDSSHADVAEAETVVADTHADTPAESEQAHGVAATEATEAVIPEPAPIVEAEAAAPMLINEAGYSNCMACHQATGQGIPAAFPPLVGHAPEIYHANRDYLPRLMANGLQGQIEVSGMSYNGAMPVAWAHLSDEDVAGILNYVLTAWGNDALLPADFQPYTAADIAAARGDVIGMQGMYHYRQETLQ